MTATLRRILGKLTCILTESHRFEEREDGNRQCHRCGMILYTFAANSALVSGSRFTLIDARRADPEWWFAYRKSTPLVALRAFAERNPTFCPAVTARFGVTP